MNTKELTTFLFWGIIALVIVGTVVFSLFNKANIPEKVSEQNTTMTFEKTEIKVKDISLSVELADTPAKRARGLMFRESMAQNEGMFFIFPTSGKHTFWMAHTKIPLDIIWINEDFNIVYVSENTPPCTQVGTLKSYCTTYRPDKDAKYVLEVNGGWFAENNIGLGDTISLPENKIERDE